MSYFPLEVSRSGDFVAGLVTVPRPIEPANRPALWTPGGRVGREDELQMDSDERAWAAIQLSKSNRHKQMIAELIRQGKLTLRPGLPSFGTTPSGPITTWALDALHYRRAMEALEQDPKVVLPQSLWNRLDLAGSAAALLRILEPVAVLPQPIWDQLDELVGQETEHRNEGIFAQGELDKSAKYHATVARLIAGQEGAH